MTKLRGPLFSIDAKGKLGKSLVFSSNKNIKRVSKYYTPRNPKTIIQQDNRSIFSYAVASWQSLDEGQKEDYNQSAANLGLKMSGYNYYIQTYMAAYGPVIDFPFTNGLISRWTLDETSGPTVYDWWGTNHGTIYGATPTAGKLNGAYLFDGNDDYIAIVGKPVLLGTPQSISLLIKTSTVGISYIIGNNSFTLSEEGSCIRLGSDGKIDMLVAYHGVGEGFKADVSPVITDGEWYHLVMTWDGTTGTGNLKFYTDKIETGSQNIGAGSTNQVERDLVMGANTTTKGSVLNGVLDDITIWNRVLSEAEITELYNFYMT